MNRGTSSPASIIHTVTRPALRPFGPLNDSRIKYLVPNSRYLALFGITHQQRPNILFQDLVVIDLVAERAKEY